MQIEGVRFVLSHPCAMKLAQGWGTLDLRIDGGRNAGPSTALRFAPNERRNSPFGESVAQDDKFLHGCGR
jgi:hypothetical protein